MLLQLELCNIHHIAPPVFVNRSFSDKVYVWNLWQDAVLFSAGIWFLANINSTARCTSGNVESFNQQWPYKVNTIFVLGKYQSHGSRDKTFTKQTQAGLGWNLWNVNKWPEKANSLTLIEQKCLPKTEKNCRLWKLSQSARLLHIYWYQFI